MARPPSEEKKLALLDAATDVVAALGVSAPTASIAKKAGVAEGTLFRYFSTKEVLFRELFVYLSEDLSGVLARAYEPSAPLKARTWTLWSNFIDWGLAHPARHRAMAQLAVAGVGDGNAVGQCKDLRSAVTDACDFSELGAKRSTEFAEAALSAVAQVTIQAAEQEPERAEAYKQVGFGIIWRGIVGA
jgi:AcrR family transcriptional regulator